MPAPILPHWIEFRDREPGCVEAEGEAAAVAIARQFGDPTRVRRLPYPADPRLNPFAHPQWGVAPSFCFAPRKCAGETSCPHRYACSE